MRARALATGRRLGRLLEMYRNYLRLVARTMIGQACRSGSMRPTWSRRHS